MTAPALAPVVDPVLPDPTLRIGGVGVAASDGGTYTSINPADESTVVEIAAATADDVDRAVAASRAVFDSGVWSELPGSERGRILARAADLIEADAENLAALEAVEMGKLYQHSVAGDMPATAGTFRHFAGWADKITGQTTALPDFAGQHRFGFTMRQPVGVVGAITPWNNPAVIAGWKLAPALAAGCTVVVKPAEDAALSTIRLAELLSEAGLPDGVVNVVTGLGPVAGAALAGHAGLDKITFTGSPRVGRGITPLAGDKFRKMTLELGGKSPQIVFPDADLDAAMPWIAMGNFYHQGQVCAAGTRVLVNESIADDVVARLVAIAESSVIGDPRDPSSTMGTIVNAKQLDSILGYIETGKSEGAQLITGGARVDRPGFFVEPTVFRGTNDLTIAREEIFGPVATVITFRDTDEAIRIANDTRFGLNAMIYTSDLSTAHSVIPRLRVGTVWVNGWGVPEPHLPWGGREASGFGRELGLSGVTAHTEEKTVHLAF
ncbi:betaine-aldehyde dehydrogenase [Williamsia sp. Leaf354]|jgi:betaine-aldehyde dehydrogenase|uniref:aldehyde dehydrogenase family protein n=1 Tax=Williamsia sp. Leaf354 TaxID=1736349 RepID=UPI0006FC3AA4|nr:aldehyde dehydrogenase family protein [Williamsia sp. Leaf354]KQR97946.1 betaine-aldehyde dehydrogenase [Williamsia sp. Leaf354]